MKGVAIATLLDNLVQLLPLQLTALIAIQLIQMS